MPTPVSYSITATSSGATRALTQVSTGARQAATDVTAASGKIDRAMDQAAAAAKRLATAERSVANAAGSVRLAESQLAAVRSRANATTTQKIAAEERLYAANRRLAASEKDVADASHAAQRNTFVGAVTEHSGDIDRVATSLTRVGIAGAVGLAAVSKAAVDWQSDWAGVTKTVDGTAPQMNELEGSLRGLARTLPASHHDIAAVAEAAGQLGIQRESVAAFTKTMIDLGETTNLSADEAATSLAQFSNVMGTSSNDVGRLGATIVDLGNKGASTERDIVGMGLRIAGAGKQIGLSETDVLAFASALSSTGIEAEAGGSAISQSFLKIDAAVRTGGRGLETLASISGKSAAQFADDFRSKPAAAVNDFVEGLGRVQDRGGDVTKVLKSLGISGIRESDALRRLASSGDLLSDSLATGNTAWRQNSALVDEAAKRYATAESQGRIAWNQIKDSAITAGTAMLPILAQVATAVGQVATFFGNLPAPVRMAGVAMLVTVTAMSLLGGGALKAITGLVGLRGAFIGAGVAATTAGRAMKIAQLSIPVVGLLLFGATAALQAWAAKSTDAATGADAFASAMETVEGAVTRATAAMNENVRMAAVQNLQQAGSFDQAKMLGLSLSDVTDASLGNVDAIGRVNAVLKTNLALNPQVSKSNSDLHNAASELAQTMGSVAHGSIDAIAAENDRRAAMEQGVGATKTAKEAATDYAQAQADVAQSIQQAEAAATGAAAAYVTLTNAQVAAQQAIDAVKNRTDKQKGAGLNKKTKSGQENQGALNNVISTQSQLYNRAVDTQDPEKVAAAYRKSAKVIADAKAEFGGGKKAADDFAASILQIPPEIRSQIVFEGADISAKQAKSLNDDLEGLPAETRTAIVTIANTKGAAAARRALEEIKDKRVIARADGSSGGAKSVKKAMDALNDRYVKAVARGDKKGADAVREAIARVKSKEAMVRVKADKSGALEARTAIATVKGKTVTVTIVRKSRGDADGGPITHTLPHFDEGGRIRGDGGPREDNVAGVDRKTGLQTSWVSVGEWVVDARTTARNADNLQKMKDAPGRRWELTPVLADGGYARLPLLASGGKSKKPTIDAQVVRVITAQAAVDNARTLAERTKAEKELTKATKKLTEAQTNTIDAVKQLSTSLLEPYRSKTTDATDLLVQMQEGVKDLGSFAAQLKQLKDAGLSQALIDQVTAQGAVGGADLAASILAGGSTLVTSLNQANAALTTTAANIGLTATGVKGHANGTPSAATGLAWVGEQGPELVRFRGGESVRTAPESRAIARQVVERNYAQTAARMAAPVVVQSDSGYHDHSQITVMGGGDSADRIAQRVQQRRRDRYASRGLIGRRVK